MSRSLRGKMNFIKETREIEKLHKMFYKLISWIYGPLLGIHGFKSIGA